jgi:hypothetical protein
MMYGSKIGISDFGSEAGFTPKQQATSDRRYAISYRLCVHTKANCLFVKMSVNEIIIACSVFYNFQQLYISLFFSSLLSVLMRCTQDGSFNVAISHYK